MKILFIGELNPHGRSFQRKRALQELGHEIQAYSWSRIDENPDSRGTLWRRIIGKLGFPPDLTQINQTIIQEIAHLQPDVLWIEKGNTIKPSTLQKVKQLSPNTKLISNTEDDLFAAHNRSWLYTWGAKYYDLHFTTKSYNCRPEELPSLGAKKIIFLDNTYDIHTHRPMQLTEAERSQFGSDIGFIGTYEAERADSLLYLAEHGLQVRVWGAGRWYKLQHKCPQLLIENRPLYSDDYARAICATRVNLCFLRKQNRDLQTSRTMEIPACAAFMLAERTQEQMRLFEEGHEAAYFGSNVELLEKAKYYLAHENERQAIAYAGRQRCVESGYSHHDRLAYMLAQVAQLA